MRTKGLALAALFIAGLGCARSGVVQPTSTPEPVVDPPTATATSAPATATSTARPTNTATATLTPSPTPTITPAGEARISGLDPERVFQIPLTIQHLSPTGAILHFELDQPSGGHLLYRPLQSGSSGWYLAPLDPDRPDQQIVLPGLSSDTRYEIRIGLGSELSSLREPTFRGRVWGPVRFRTPVADGLQVRFGVLGDSGLGQPETWNLVDRIAGQNLDFVLHTGDMVYLPHEQESAAQAYVAKFFEPFARVLTDLPLHAVPGNHDYDRELLVRGTPYYQRIQPAFDDPQISGENTPQWYAFSSAGIQFLMLDSQVFHGVSGRAEQTEWLQERLSDPSFRFSIPVFHVPPFTSGRHSTDGRALRSEWLPLFEAAGVPLVFSGHDHNYERIHWNGVTYIVSGGGSATLYAERRTVEGSQVFEMATHFVLVEIDEQQIELTAISLSGSILDRASIALPD